MDIDQQQGIECASKPSPIFSELRALSFVGIILVLFFDMIDKTVHGFALMSLLSIIADVKVPRGFSGAIIDTDLFGEDGDVCCGQDIISSSKLE